VLELSAKNQQTVILITSDDGMIKICEKENIAIFDPRNQTA
jgi:hypothetical protein